MSYVLKVKNNNFSVPLDKPQQLWLLNEFNPRLPLVMVITGWTTNFNDTENPTLDVIYSAYRCRGNVNFVVCSDFVYTMNFIPFRLNHIVFFFKFPFDTDHRLLIQVSFINFNRFFILVRYENFWLIYCFFPFHFITAGFVDTLYSWSAFNTEEIGNVISESLSFLIKTYPIQKIHLIGHSLGAHSKFLH